MKIIYFLSIIFTLGVEVLLTTKLFEIIFGMEWGAITGMLLLGISIFIGLSVYFINFYFFQKKIKKDVNLLLSNNLNIYIISNISFLCIFIILPVMGFYYFEQNPIFDNVFIIPLILIIIMFLWVNHILFKIEKLKITKKL